MNTVASQVTLFTDDSVDCSGPIRPGPSLYEWATGGKRGSDGSHQRGGPDELGPDDYPTRAQYGRYLEWVFAEVVRGAPPGIRVEVHGTRAVRLDDAPDDAPGEGSGSRSPRAGCSPASPPWSSPRATCPPSRTGPSGA